MKFPLRRVAQAIGATCESDALATGWSVDSRTIVAGDLFIALRGENHDGHDHVAKAFEKGAVAAIVERDAPGNGPKLIVPDALAALRQLAIWARREWNGYVIAVTGSAGKTTTKDLVAEVLASAFSVGKTVGNFNNHIGLPLSILRLPESARMAVLELGMNHEGEIRDLSRISGHRIAVVTNVGYAHIENFDSVEGIAAAKRELVEALPPDGIAVLNADDARVAKFAESHPGRSIFYGIDSPLAEVRATDPVLTFDGSRFKVDGVEFETSTPGRHNILNILAAIAVAKVFGVPAKALTEAVRGIEAPKMRGQRKVHNGILVIDDCYNSNPDAACAMIDFLAQSRAWKSSQQPGRAIAVLGEMRELGGASAGLHAQSGRHAAARGIDYVIGVKGDARFTVDGALAAGMSAVHARFAEEPLAGGDIAREVAQTGDVILFKGSRGTQMELALGRFLA